MDDAPQDGSPAASTGLRKVFSKPNRVQTTNDFESTTTSSRSGGNSNRPSSVDSNADVPRPQTSGAADDSAKGISKLLQRRRKKRQSAESNVLLTADDGVQRSKAQSLDDASASAASSVNGSQGPAENEAAGNQVINASDPDAMPPLSSQNPHAGFYASSSPLITTTHVDGDNPHTAPADFNRGAGSPRLTASESNPDLTLTSFTQNGSTLEAPVDRWRGVSPGRTLRGAFNPSPDKRSASSSPDRGASPRSLGGKDVRGFFSRSRSNSLGRSLSARLTAKTESPPPPVPNQIRVDTVISSKAASYSGPRTPPSTDQALATTVTPPTPPDQHPALTRVVTEQVTASPVELSENGSPTGNLISHRRVRSADAVHEPSKLSNSTTLDTAGEDAKTTGSKTPSALQTGFFSTMFSAAQNAASTLSSSLNAQARNRSVTQPAPAHGEKPAVDGAADDDAHSDGQISSEGRRELAVDTLGMGDLNLSQFEADAAPGGVVTTKDGIVITKPDVAIEIRKKTTASQRDEMAARIEDIRAARAISMAYKEPPPGITSATPPLAAGDGLEVRPSAAVGGESGGDQTPPNGSVFEGDVSAGKRGESVRNRLSKRRQTGSSAATTGSLGPTGASAMAVGIPGANASAPRLTGFAVASKKRNRDFHQLFRSVPEDDYLIEDYSCALQREIILAGRIYISEGHICFSSNILGWVTTLVISFDEIMAIEKETTAMVFPNAIAIQTLHARHTFRSLLSRESTYDLMVNIWKINHPALKSFVNGTRVAQGTGDKTEKADGSDAGSDETEEEDEIYDEDEEGDAVESFMEPGEGSVGGSERADSINNLSRKLSGLQPNGTGSAASPSNLAADAKGGERTGAASGDAGADFPGPATHPPTEFADPAGRYDKVVKDEVIPAPLGQIYSLVFGPASGAFMSKFLVENQKVTELQLEDDKRGLTNESKTRKYTYIKPLNGSIGPKQTKCISEETLDFFDLEKAVLVTLSTQTPDVPSGNVFCVKTKYLFTWAPGNQTRFFMSCMIEWSGKSWIKGPIEKGANDGQVSFGNDLVKALKASLAPRSPATGPSKGKGKGGKGKRKKGDAAIPAVAEVPASAETPKEPEGWGMLEPLRAPLSPVVDVLKPLWNGNVAVGVIVFLLFLVFMRGPSRQPAAPSHGGVAYPGLTVPQRLAAYEEMWRREESELWNWLEDRVGMDGLSFPIIDRTHESLMHQRELRQRLRAGKDLVARLNEERMSEREMGHAIRVTRERLEALEEVLKKRQSQRQTDEDELAHVELRA
ncbi:hypothetical protein VTN02DRAFT_4056 [Thermoascus thermophilus]